MYTDRFVIYVVLNYGQNYDQYWLHVQYMWTHFWTKFNYMYFFEFWNWNIEITKIYVYMMMHDMHSEGWNFLEK